MKKKETRKLEDLYSVGPATVRDLKLLGITHVEHLVGKDARALYERPGRPFGETPRSLRDGRRILGGDRPGAGSRSAERKAQVVVLEPDPQIPHEITRAKFAHDERIVCPTIANNAAEILE